MASMFPLFFIVVFLSFTIKAATLPPTANLHISSRFKDTAHKILRNTEMKCFISTYRSKIAKVSDCITAINLLPKDVESGTFHSSGSYDEYILPATKLGGECAVKVSIQDKETDESSWLDVVNAAMEIVEACEKRGFFPRRKDGRIRVYG